MEEEMFKVVEDVNMPKVLAALKEDWPKHFVLHQILTVLNEYKKAGTIMQHTLFLYGDYKGGVYLNKILVELPQFQSQYFYIYTANSDVNELKNALAKTKLIPWQDKNIKVSFLMIPRQYQSSITEVFAKNSISPTIHDNSLFWFPPDKTLSIDPLPNELTCKLLDGSHAELMDKNWPHRFPGSERMHRESLQKNFGIGLFKNSDMKMVCSCLSNFSGGIFVLYSEPEIRGKGYAQLLIQRMVQELRKRGRIPFCTVIKGNTPSEKVFGRVGFQLFMNVDYIFT